jgi:OmpA-OmpF porin, OOP family
MARTGCRAKRGVSGGVGLAGLLIVCTSLPAAADPYQVGGWFGPRVYSKDSSLGYIDDAPFHPMLQGTMALGGRIARPLYPWLVPELELALSVPKTTRTGAEPVSVFWLDPRVHVRFELMPEERLQPFIVVGGSAPIALSTATRTFGNGIVGDGYVGLGVRYDTGKAFTLRSDVRVAILPGAESPITSEIDIGFGVEFALGRGARRRATTRVVQESMAADRDGDGMVDGKDACPDRAEDQDGFDDSDGCPDIDNDLDRVLDVADKCATVPETYNGFEDDDGCPDAVPPDVEAIRGTIEGLIYADGETGVRRSAQRSINKIAKVLADHPAVRVVLIGHTDDREAKGFAAGQPEQDPAALSADLSRARAEAVKQAIVKAGVDATRIDVEGKGAEDAVADNDKPRGRLANRRVELQLYIPPGR